jgi:NAD(P)-dependent dehydrogenase (short-subunit alcohol dehydrogenase family)
MLDNGTVALVSGANRGLGRYFVEALLAAGAKKVYACARTPAELPFDDVRVVRFQLDVTQASDVLAAARLAPDVTLLINNAGINHLSRALYAQNADAARAEMEVNYFGTLAMCRAFAPILTTNAATHLCAIVNVISILARVALPAMGSLCASKAAALRMTESMRAELAAHAVRVIGILPGAIDTDMSRDFPPPKLAVSEVVEATFAALRKASGVAATATPQSDDIYVGAVAQGVAAALAQDRAAVQSQFAQYL